MHLAYKDIDRVDKQLDGCYYPMEPPIDFHWALRDLADKEAASGQLGPRVQNSQVSGQHPCWSEKMHKYEL